MKGKKVAIIGTCGIPARYGGFETLAENIVGFFPEKITLTVYCSSKTYTKKLNHYKKANLKYIPLYANGIQSIGYDIISLFSAANKNDIIFIFGVSGCIILPLFRLFYPSKKLIINIDGLEYKRDKWKKPIRKFLKLSEKLAVKYCDKIIADNKTIQQYIKEEYNKNSYFIAYGGNHVTKRSLSAPLKNKYQIPNKYACMVCRIEPENNVHLILEAFSTLSFPLVIIGNWEHSQYGKQLKNEFGQRKNIFLLDSIYDQDELNQIRSNCSFYVHGHSAGGTNPALVEAMYLGLPVIAYDVPYNRETTFNKAKYFSSVEDLKKIINEIRHTELSKIGSELQKQAKKEYTWEKISAKYLSLIN